MRAPTNSPNLWEETLQGTMALALASSGGNTTAKASFLGFPYFKGLWFSDKEKNLEDGWPESIFHDVQLGPGSFLSIRRMQLTVPSADQQYKWLERTEKGSTAKAPSQNASMSILLCARSWEDYFEGSQTN